MSTLDEDLIDQIRNSEPFRKAFLRYRADLIKQFIGQFGLSIVLIAALLIIFLPSIKFLFFTKNILMGMLFLAVFLGSLSVIYNTINSFRDLMSQELDIQPDIFMNIENAADFNSVLQHETAYSINLVDAGVLLLSYEKTRQYKTGTMVYVIRTGVSKTLLDVIPKEEL